MMRVLVYFLFLTSTWSNAYDPIPCCHIANARPNLHIKPLRIASIYLTGNNTCDGFSLAKITSTRYGTSGLSYTECANGLNVIAFLLHITSELSNIKSNDFIKLRASMLSIRTEFDFNVLLKSNLNKYQYIWKNG